MPSPRRVRLIFVLILLFVVTLLFYTASQRQTQIQDPRTFSDFYSRTVNALDKKSPNTNSGTEEGRNDDDEEVAKAMARRLKEAAQVAKDKANAKAPKPDPPSVVVGKGSAAQGGGREEKSVAGRKKYPMGDGAQEIIKEEEEEETQEDHDVEIELNSILKKSPIIIFSKSYCPHSKRAKTILLERYTIEPPPFVVELDQHPLGAQLQARLAKLTGRRTVPNVLVNAVSIGGGDDVAALDDSKTLVAKVKDLAGKKVTDIREREEEQQHGLK